MSKKKIELDHGSGGKISNSMISDLILPIFNNPMLSELNDGAVFDISGQKLAFSTDSYVVDPLFFPGGDIGDLAVNGTVNDVSMCGAKPLYLSCGFIMEEGFPMEDLEAIIRSMKRAADKAGVAIVTGDTKVVSRGCADKIFINTSGVGVVYDNFYVSGNNAKPGDRIILSGTMADHGITVLTQRDGMAFDTSICSDSAPLNHMVEKIVNTHADVSVLRDPTRGGVGTTLNEIADQSQVTVKLYEEKLPVKNQVAGVCELLGFDPLYVANEGKLLVFVAEKDVEKVLEAVKQDEYGKDAVIIGEVTEKSEGQVILETRIGGSRIVDMLTGEQLPRIC